MSKSGTDPNANNTFRDAWSGDGSQRKVGIKDPLAVNAVRNTSSAKGSKDGESKKKMNKKSSALSGSQAEGYAMAPGSGKAAETTTDRMKRKKKSSGKILFIVWSFVLLFLGFGAYLIDFQLTKRGELEQDARNPKLVERQKLVSMGQILASDEKTVLATNAKDQNGKNLKIDGQQVRKYPQGSLFAHTVGYSAKGRSGLEKSMYAELLSVPKGQPDLIDELKKVAGKQGPLIGNTVVTTLDARMQKVAYDAMGKRKGAVILMEPGTGKIRTMVSKPSFDPNKVDENWQALNTDEENSPLLNRATQGQYPPGSTFKVLTALEYMREHPDWKNFSYDCNGVYQGHGLKIACAFYTAHGHVNLQRALEVSCNGAFIKMGLDLDIGKYRDFVESFGFNGTLPLENVSYAESLFRLKPGASYGEIMHTAFGQGNTLVTPVLNCFIASTIANDGVMMKAKLVDHVLDANRQVVRDYKVEEAKKVLEVGESHTIRDMMAGVVTNGIAGELANDRYTVAAKTGTAQYNDGNNTHNLIIGFAPVEKPKIAFSIILEGYPGQPQIDHDLMRVTKTVLDAYFAN